MASTQVNAHSVVRRRGATVAVRNGVTVTVRRSGNGSVVDATCQCFGHPQRVDSIEDCPNRQK
ncbi:hypothetical protein GS896_25545 [Rhodococcus hoagii]|nr:hypothetical protein [Prescottella equi]MBM4654129.1 hypothetical protein [Prescottella equi]NKT55987.1 hypothetical protein [Prescottella equi]